MKLYITTPSPFARKCRIVAREKGVSIEEIAVDPYGNAPELLATDYGREIWALFEKGLLQADTPLTGRFTQPVKPVNLGDVLAVIDDAKDEEAARRLRMQTPR